MQDTLTRKIYIDDVFAFRFREFYQLKVVIISSSFKLNQNVALSIIVLLLVKCNSIPCGITISSIARRIFASFNIENVSQLFLLLNTNTYTMNRTKENSIQIKVNG